MIYFGIMLAIYMIFLGTGLFRGRRGKRKFAIIAVQLYNARINRMQSVPYRHLREALEQKQLLQAALYIAAINFGMLVLQFLLGLILLAPFLAGLNGQISGYILSWGDDQYVYPYGLLQAFLQFSAFATAASAGMMIGMGWLYYELSFQASLFHAPVQTVAVLCVSLLLLLFGAVAEAAGPIYWGVEGVPSQDAIRRKVYLKV